MSWVGPTECTQDGQGGLGPQETLGCARPMKWGQKLFVIPECTQDGQGGQGPQETQGRTRRTVANMLPPPPLREARVGSGVSGGRNPRRTPLAGSPTGVKPDPGVS